MSDQYDTLGAGEPIGRHLGSVEALTGLTGRPGTASI